MIGEASAPREAFRGSYRAAARAEAEARPDRLLGVAERAVLPTFSFAAGLWGLQKELLAYFDEPITNGYAEAVISKVKVIKGRAYGLPSFVSFPRRVLGACG